MRSLLLLLLFLLLLIGNSQTPEAIPGGRLLEEARLLLDAARYTQALARAQEALQQQEAGSLGASACLLVMGDAFLETGDLEGAFQQYNLALRDRTRLLGAKHLVTAEALNRVGEYYYRKSDFNTAQQFFQKALAARSISLGSWHELVADGYNNLGNCAVGSGKYAEGAALHEKALEIREKVSPAGHPDLATSYNNLGNCAYLNGQPELALGYFEKALVIRKQVFGPEHPKTAQIMNNLGNVYALLGERFLAIQHYQTALQIRQKHFGDQSLAVAAALENLADLYADGGDYIAALDYYRRAYSIQKKIKGGQSAAAASLWHNIGMCYQFEGDFDRALTQYREAEADLISAFGSLHPMIGGLYNNQGNSCAGKKDYVAARNYYEKAMQVFKRQFPLPVAQLALVHNNLGDVYLRMNEPAVALDYFEQAAALLLKSRVGSSADYAECLKNQGLALERLGKWQKAGQVFEQAIQLAEDIDPVSGNAILDAWATLLCRRGTEQRDSGLLRQSIQLFDKSRQRSDSLRTLLNSPGARQRWLELQFPAHASALEACYHLWQLNGDKTLLEKAFALSERNKSVQLLEHLRKEQAEHIAAIPDSLLEKERYWSEMLNGKEKAALAVQRSRDPRKNIAADMAVSTARQQLNEILAFLEKNYPEYYKLKYDQRTASVAEIQQNMLTAGQALLEYFVSDSAVFVFVVKTGDFQCVRLPLHFPMDASVSGLRKTLHAYPEAGASTAPGLADEFVRHARTLYEGIFAPVKQAISLPEKLIIVPDGTLAYLPFECLLMETPEAAGRFKSHHYLIRDYCVSYAHSATQQIALLQSASPVFTQNLLAVAPVYAQNRFGLGPLQNNRIEADAAQRLFGGEVLEGSAATIPAFSAAAGRAHILLLAMHGKASSTVGDMSYIAFSTGYDSTANPFLFARDLYSRSIPADLVVLSACETSVGAYRYGQGAVSLAKGFFQAGARSVAATLWSVDDAKNATLMRLFLDGINDGLAKDDALRKAKLAFLRTHPHDEAHPVFWAAVTAYGDMRPVALEGGQGWWIGMAALAVLVLVLYRWFRKPR